MRLSKIKLAGFKSFVDPTNLDLTSNLTAVVGPNGCGKSNIIDAIRWVMGESSAKNLRGGALTDVIFNGSSSRKPIGQASVELVFDNSDGTLGGEYSGFSEIALKRLVTRDGQSSYFINGQRARRKDITDIFLGTGLGPRSYAIIEQGMISRVIEAKPDDMRNFIEEAAGVSKYKERRRETETRIKHTQDNLNRLNDLRIELERQVNSLERQAEAAQKYQTLKEQSKTIEVELTAMSWQRLNREIEQFNAQIRDVTTEIEKHQAQLTHLRAILEEQREQQSERNDYLNEVQKQYYSVGNDITKIEQTIENIAEQIKTLQDNQREERNAMQHAQAGLVQDQQTIARLEQLLETLSPREEILQGQIESLTEQLEEKELQLEEGRAQHHEIQQSLNLATQEAEKEKTHIEHLEKTVQQANVRYEKLKIELSQMQGGEDLSAITQLESELTTAQLQQTQAERTLEEHRAQHNQQKNEMAELKKEIKQTEKDRQKIKDDLTTLQAICAVRLGKENKGISTWLAEKGLSEHPRLAEVLQVDPQWQLAVETLLAQQLDAIYLENDEIQHLIADIDTRPVEGLSLTVSSCDQDFLTPDQSVLRKITNPHVLSQSVISQLSRIWFVEDIQEGYLRVAENKDISVITRRGIWIGHGFIRIPTQYKEKQQSVLELTQDIKRFTEIYQTADAQYTQLLKQMEVLELKDIEFSQQIEDALDRFTGLKQRCFNLQSEVKIRRNKYEQVRQRTGQINEDIQDLQAQIRTANESIGASREKLHDALDKMAASNERLSEHAGDKSVLEEERRQYRDTLKAYKDEYHQLALQCQGATSELKALRQNIERFHAQIKNSQERLERIAQSIVSVQAPEDTLRERLEQTLQQRLEVEDLLNQARDAMHEGENQIKTVESKIQDILHTVESLRTQLEQTKMNWQTAKVHMESVTDKITQKEMDVQSVLTTLSPEAVESEWLLQLERLERQISRLGPINLAAIEEYSSAKERKTYLDQQHNDLTEALMTLENAIKKIDKETKDRFRETFDKINHGFQSLFPRLFGGGESSIILTGDDLLNTGVTVMARPPGKKNASIQLLSGGEKALTAVAFVFSIFLLNPAPFCLLDEVDAPLDDNNVGRFCNLVKEMSENVQFIFISHNKIAIAMAEQLHGVTMREAGVSRLVSVDLEEAVQLAG